MQEQKARRLVCQPARKCVRRRRTSNLWDKNLRFHRKFREHIFYKPAKTVGEFFCTLFHVLTLPESPRQEKKELSPEKTLYFYISPKTLIFRAIYIYIPED